MPNGEAYDELIRREIEIMEMHLYAGAIRSAVTIETYVKSRVTAGASKTAIKAELLKDLKEGGRIFGEFRNAVKATANGVMSRTRDIAQIDEHGLEQDFKWVAVLDERTCPDCERRHGQSKSWDEWESEGLPRTGATKCGNYCRCILVPQGVPDIEPVRRKRRKK